MFGTLKELFSYKELIYHLVSRDLKVRYKRSVLGVLWAFLEPLVLMALFTVVFSLVMRIKIDNYPAFLLCGVIAWNFFTTGINYSLSSVTQNANLVKKIYFPRSILPLSTIFGRMVHFFLSLLLLAPFLAYFGVKPSFNLFFLPVVMLAQVILITGFSLLFSGLNVLYRDVGFLLNFAFFGLFYLTPVFYSPQMVPDRFRDLYMLNPMAILITSHRDVLLYARMPDLHQLAFCYAVGFLFFWLGFKVFKRVETVFAEVL